MRLHDAWPHESEQTPQNIYRTPMEGQNGGNNGLTWHLLRAARAGYPDVEKGLPERVKRERGCRRVVRFLYAQVLLLLDYYGYIVTHRCRDATSSPLPRAGNGTKGMWNAELEAVIAVDYFHNISSLDGLDRVMGGLRYLSNMRESRPMSMNLDSRYVRSCPASAAGARRSKNTPRRDSLHSTE